MRKKYDEYNGNEMIQLTRDKGYGWKTKSEVSKESEREKRARRNINRKIQSYIPFYC